jgi:DNA-binding CsgD family transcriptional regulator
MGWTEERAKLHAPPRDNGHARQVQKLKSEFGLTDAESQFALYLFAGLSLRAAARKRSVTYETARTSIKTIFRKTETRRQGQLVAAIAKLMYEQGQ